MEALIVGKGPSARPVGNPGFPVIALNGAAVLCGRIDWLVCNDVEMLAAIDPEDIQRARRVLLPSLMHRDGGDGLVCHGSVRPALMGRPVDLYELHSNQSRNSALPYFGEIWSVGETAVAWLLHQGYTRLHTLGIDPDGGYAERFQSQGANGPEPEWFRENHRRICRRAANAGATIERWEPLP